MATIIILLSEKKNRASMQEYIKTRIFELCGIITVALASQDMYQNTHLQINKKIYK
ncbi:MAG: hypothetical protein JO131_07990 [Gammaproteobacteria bacterium]|nr:hypothetical protein [Gammaproteobacteria bacterium]